jgi:hypothetical protein
MNVQESGGLSWEAVCRRAGGRRRYNAGRKFLRNVRRAQVFLRLLSAGLWDDPPQPLPCGFQAALAQMLGVSPATISRDVRALRSPGYRMPKLGTTPRHLAHLDQRG